MNKPKVFILGKLPPPYFGPAVATQVILQSKLKEKFELIHINTVLNTQMEYIGRFAWQKTIKGLFIYINYIRQLIKYKPELILIPHGQTTPAFLKDSVFIFLGWLIGSHVLLHLRGSDWKNWLSGVTKFTKWYVLKILKLTSGVIVLGEKLRHLFSEDFSEDQIFVVPNGANYEFPDMPVKKFNSSKILFFSNLLPSKGVEDVLQAIRIIKKDNLKEIHWTFAGEWANDEFRKNCNEYVRVHKLDITFSPPAIGDMKVELFSNSDIFIFPPRNPEGHPWVVIEAMAAGLPIISTDQGAITESVINNVNGFIVEPQAPEEIAEKIKYLTNNPEEKIRMGKESRRIYEENFTEDKMVERLSNVFNQIIAYK